MMDIADTPSGSDEWQAFITRPADYAEPRRMAECFGGAIGEEACERMLRAERLRLRLSNLLIGHYRLDSFADEVAPVDRMIALSSAEQLEQIALTAGAIYWSDSFAAGIMATTAAALQERFGEDLYIFALANRDLAGPVQPLEPLETIYQRVLSDGWHCVGAWCRATATPVGDRVRLKLPPDHLVDEPPPTGFIETGAQIVRRVAEHG